jgi:hypothetical protein
MRPSLFGAILLLASFTSHAETKRPSYEEFKQDIKTKKPALKKKPLSETKSFLFKLISHHMPEYWKGTEWNFNGTSRKPGQGSIACGYFVTTILDDIGIPIERVAMAQKAASEVINAFTTNIKTFYSVDALKKHVLAAPDNEVYIVGLDYHIGFLVRDKNKIHFIHSNSFNRKGADKENAELSDTLAISSLFMIGSLSGNDALLKRWLEG